MLYYTNETSFGTRVTTAGTADYDTTSTACACEDSTAEETVIYINASTDSESEKEFKEQIDVMFEVESFFIRKYKREKEIIKQMSKAAQTVMYSKRNLSCSPQTPNKWLRMQKRR